jgi:4-amino-4-deoxy-L-arabinose transferase-like glycosyltransferase
VNRASEPNEFRVAAGIFALALAVRTLYLWESSANPSFDAPVVDSFNYHIRAKSLADGAGMRDDYFTYGLFYQGFLALVYFVSGSSILFARVVQVVLGSVTCAITFRLGRRVFGHRVGLAAGVITALYGPLVFFESELLATGWAAFWSVALALTFTTALEGARLRSYLALGICGALSTITRATFLPFFSIGVLWLIARSRPTHTGLRPLGIRAGAILIGFSLVAIPAGLQPLRVTGSFSFLPASGGLNMFIGNNPESAQTVMIRPGQGYLDLVNIPAGFGAEGIWESQEFFQSVVLHYVRDHPLDFARGILRKSIEFVSSREIPRSVDIYVFREWSRMLSVLVWKASGFGFPFGVLLPFAVLGSILCWRKVPVPLRLFLLLYPAAVVLVFVSARYRTPAVPLLAVLAAAGGAAVLRVARGGSWRERALVLGAGAATACLAILPGPFPQERLNYKAELYHDIAIGQAITGRREEALSALYKAVELEPGYAFAYEGIGYLLANTGRLDEAARELREALRLEPDHAGLHRALANVLRAQGRQRQANAQLEKAMRIDELRIDALRAKLSALLGDSADWPKGNREGR